MRERKAPTEVTCRLASVLGRAESCPETLCAYWESAEGRTTTNGCALHEITPFLRTQPALARELLELRARIEDVRER